MNYNATYLEILLLCNSSYFKRDWVELKENKNDKQLSQKEQLVQLCWNGILNEVIPEIMEKRKDRKDLTLWEINESGNMLDLRYGNFDQVINDKWSINPYLYLTFACAN